MWNDSQINKYTYNLSSRYRNKCVSLQSQIKIMSEIEQLVRGGLYEKYEWAFWGCKHLRRLLIPEWVTCIEGGIVTAHEGFEGVECHAKGFHVENDALIDDERQELLCCWTQQKNYVVPGCVKRIADISGNDFVETIIVKQPVELTTCEVFASDTNLKQVEFQGGVTGVTSQTFWNCPKLKNE